MGIIVVGVKHLKQRQCKRNTAWKFAGRVMMTILSKKRVFRREARMGNEMRTTIIFSNMFSKLGSGYQTFGRPRAQTEVVCASCVLEIHTNYF